MAARLGLPAKGWQPVASGCDATRPTAPVLMVRACCLSRPLRMGSVSSTVIVQRLIYESGVGQTRKSAWCSCVFNCRGL
jgi:hypothetical protein